MNRPLLAWYGDDFTGSTDVMEVLQWSGLRTVLFLDPPTTNQLNSFDNLRAFGVAGRSRSMSCEEMRAELKPVFSRLRESGAKIVHYKTCSTCDSSPEIGNIGEAIEIGREVFGPSPIPIVIGAPGLGRYQVFGNLFARSGLDTEPFRLDRHPTMRQHPITPMDEADLREHLKRQTDVPIELFDVLRLDAAAQPDDAGILTSSNAAAVLFDVLTDEHLNRIGNLIQQTLPRDVDTNETHAVPRFVVGSSGIEFALTASWSQSGMMDSLRSHPAGQPTFAATEQIAAITGSCSPVTARQIDRAEQDGFETIALNTPRLVSCTHRDEEIRSAVRQALDRLKKGASVILHSSRGPDDPRVSDTLDEFRSLDLNDTEIKLNSGRVLGPQLGQIMLRILAEHPLKRVGVAGGDTSGFVARELGITALEAIAPVAPGSPLCRAHAENQLDGIEVFFKGGQVGHDNVWNTILNGT